MWNEEAESWQGLEQGSRVVHPLGVPSIILRMQQRFSAFCSTKRSRSSKTRRPGSLGEKAGRKTGGNLSTISRITGFRRIRCRQTRHGGARFFRGHIDSLCFRPLFSPPCLRATATACQTRRNLLSGLANSSTASVVFQPITGTMYPPLRPLRSDSL